MQRGATIGLLAWILAAVVQPAALADDEAARYWPAWRGPLHTGVAPHGDPPTEWSESKNIRWKVAIPGRAHATPIIWGDRIYIQTAVPKDAPAPEKADAGPTGRDEIFGFAQETPPPPPPPGGGPAQDRPRRGGGQRREAKPKGPNKFVVMALDRKTGKTIWERVVKEESPHESTHQDATDASNSPITDGQRIYAYFGSRGLFCLDMDGKVLWDKDFGDMETRNHFGEGSSPALHGDTLVVNWDHEQDDFITALDAKTGKELWKKERDEPTTWATPLIVEVNGKPQVITSGTNKIRSYDLKTGDIVWECAGLTQNVIPSPLYADGLLIAMSGFRGAKLFAIKLAQARGDITGTDAIAWSFEKDTPYVPSPLLYGDTLYFLENNKPVLTCLNAKTGEKFFGPQRIEGIQGIYASIVGASGRVYITGRDGKIAVLKRGPKYELLAMTELDEGFDASPAIVGKELYLRGGKHLYCIAE
jgi:outer membrane protein assembly factor BamB